jgi:hypothetical protein
VTREAGFVRYFKDPLPEVADPREVDKAFGLFEMLFP